MKTMREVIIDHLRSVGADGLAKDGCGCGLDFLCPCDNGPCGCSPAKKHVVTREDVENCYFNDPDEGDEVFVVMN